jgi:hypothetical protein
LRARRQGGHAFFVAPRCGRRVAALRGLRAQRGRAQVRDRLFVNCMTALAPAQQRLRRTVCCVHWQSQRVLSSASLVNLPCFFSNRIACSAALPLYNLPCSLPPKGACSARFPVCRFVDVSLIIKQRMLSSVSIPPLFCFCVPCRKQTHAQQRYPKPGPTRAGAASPKPTSHSLADLGSTNRPIRARASPSNLP